MKRREFLVTTGLKFAGVGLLYPFNNDQFLKTMVTKSEFEVIIIGGSSAGLSAALTLGRAMRDTLVIDSGMPCNRQTPHSHNFFTQDGITPSEMLRVARQQLNAYPTVHFLPDTALKGSKKGNGFQVSTASGKTFYGSKVLFATGINDTMPDLEGFAECWGISVIHCPYCHGYEYRKRKTGILANADAAVDIGKLVSNWTSEITIYTNGPATLSSQQGQLLAKRSIRVNEKKIKLLQHTGGHLERIVFEDGSVETLSVMYSRPAFSQHCLIPRELGCEYTPQGYLKVDMWMKTSLDGLFGAGDATTFVRSISNAALNGSIAGTAINTEFINESFV